MRKSILTLLFLAILATPTPARAQTDTPPGPVYIVQADDTLWGIAARFNVTVDELLAANNIANPNLLSIGDQLIIPGMEDLAGALVRETVPFGETLRSISRKYRVEETTLRRLNRIISPTELFAGADIILLQQEDEPAWPARANITEGGTLLELAVLNGSDPWTLKTINSLDGTYAALPGDILYLPSGSASAVPIGMPSAFLATEVSNLPIVQGTTAQVRVSVAQTGTELGGLLVDQPLFFFEDEDGSWVALQGVHALTEPGLYPLRLQAILPDGASQSFEQMVLVTSGYYTEDALLEVDENTIDPAVMQPEIEFLLSLVAPASPQKYWDGIFIGPSVYSDCFNSYFGNRRTYVSENRQTSYSSFHTGIDFCGGSGLPIFAPADGVVVFAGALEVRGNATVIDHGWGVYSGFWHQTEIRVQEGERVEAGQEIGVVGSTGRVTGAHLHWELWVNGVQVNPLKWLAAAYPKGP